MVRLLKTTKTSTEEELASEDTLDVWDLIDASDEDVCFYFPERDYAFLSFGKGPKTDIFEYEDCYKMIFDLGGIDLEDTEVLLTDTVLTIKTKKNNKHKNGCINKHLEESKFDCCCRTFVLPDGVDLDATLEFYELGTLAITLPKLNSNRVNISPIFGNKIICA